jgi:hypothetical protein
VIVRFVDIVGMDDHHFLLIDLKLLNPRYPMCMLLRGHGDKKKKRLIVLYFRYSRVQMHPSQRSVVK